MREIKAHYKDSIYDQDIVITDSEDSTYSLSFELDGIRFVGMWFSIFMLADPSQFEEAIFKFKIVKHGPYKNSYVYALQGYSICASIPVSVYDKKADKTIEASIEYEVSLKKDVKNRFLMRRCDSKYVQLDGVENESACLIVGDMSYGAGIKPSPLDDFLRKCSEQMEDEYRLVSCYTCQYSDYHPCGGLIFLNLGTDIILNIQALS